jgi:hypothetical protein
MRDFNRIAAITQKLDLLWSQPNAADMRLGQLLINVANNAGFHEDELWNIEDEDWRKALDAFFMRVTT